jgi:hypothetical protein
MFGLGFILGVAATIIVNAVGKALKLWGNRQIVGKESVEQDKI